MYEYEGGTENKLAYIHVYVCLSELFARCTDKQGTSAFSYPCRWLWHRRFVPAC